ncbi:MAG: hypothetical protein AAF961_14525, partial [Planctomycetota bacterium]
MAVMGLSLILSFIVLALIVIGGLRAMRSSGGVRGALASVFGLLLALGVGAVLIARIHVARDARHAAPNEASYSIEDLRWSRQASSRITATTPEEHDRLLQIRSRARQPDVAKARIVNGEGYEIYADGMIFHYSQGNRELLRDPGHAPSRNVVSSYQALIYRDVLPQTKEEYEALKRIRLNAKQPDAKASIVDGEGFEKYPDGMIIHSSRQRLRRSACPASGRL